ncbi:MAG: complex I NDUFA9 subunit family protein [Lysobacter sp.]|nr:complex I NDUFA9 subunit family protein [Lysobacter sp.]
MSRTIAVLGGSGFVGRALVARLLAQGERVRVLSRNVDAAARIPAGAESLIGDVFDAAFLRKAFDGADAVINLVGILNERGDDGRGFHRVYVELADTMLAAMQAAGVRRLLQMSALHAGAGDSHYLKARGAAEALVRASALDWTLFRPSVIAGPGDGLFCRFAQLLRFSPGLPIGRADARFQPVWVGDVVAAFALALDDKATVGASYDLVGPEVMTLAQIVHLTARTKGWTRFVVPLPEVFGRMQAEIGEHLPGKPISRDNWRSLQRDSTSDDNGLPKLGIAPTDVRGKLSEILGVAA